MIKLELSPGRPQLRQFAWASLVAFPLIALFLRWQFGLADGVMLALAGVGVLVAILQHGIVPLLPPAAGEALERVVTRNVWRAVVLIGFPIGFVVSHVLLAAIYYLVFTPMGIAFKLIGRDAMQRRKEPGRASYWEPRRTDRPPASYFKLY